MVDLTYPLARCYERQDGVWVIPSGAKLEVETGGDISANGNSLIDEIAALSGLDSGELGVLNGSGTTVVASKVVIADADKDIVGARQIWLGTNGASGFAGQINLQDGANPGSSASIVYADLVKIDGVTAGTVAASKAIVVDASKELDWAIADATTGTVTPLDFALTASGIGAEVDGAKFSTTTEVALGDYANGMNAKLDFGAAGSVTGLGGAMCAELDLGPGTTSGSYACFEAEMNCPASGSLGSRTSFFSLNAWGANVAAIDTGANLLDVSGVTPDTNKFFDDNGGNVAATDIIAGFRFMVNGVAYRMLACTEAAFYAG